jgi:hypothetical protein
MFSSLSGPSNGFKGRVSGDLEASDIRGPAEQSPFLGEELSAGGLGCGNDLVEALIIA